MNRAIEILSQAERGLQVWSESHGTVFLYSTNKETGTAILLTEWKKDAAFIYTDGEGILPAKGLSWEDILLPAEDLPLDSEVGVALYPDSPWIKTRYNGFGAVQEGDCRYPYLLPWEKIDPKTSRPAAGEIGWNLYRHTPLTRQQLDVAFAAFMQNRDLYEEMVTDEWVKQRVVAVNRDLKTIDFLPGKDRGEIKQLTVEYKNWKTFRNLKDPMVDCIQFLADYLHCHIHFRGLVEGRPIGDPNLFIRAYYTKQ